MVFPFTEETVIDFLQSNKSQRCIEDIVSDLKAKNQNVSELVSILKPALCAKENDIRRIGTMFLVEIIECLNSDDLNDDEVQVFWNFFADRLNDHHSVTPIVLSAGLILCKNYRLASKHFSEFLTKMLRCIVCQTQRQEDRKKIFEIIKIASESIEEDLKIMGADWIYGVINAIDGERDPRNLLLIFKFMPQLIQKYSLYHLSEEAFEVFAVYFPIDFTQSDPSGITRDTLANHLEDCLCSSQDFFEGCLELVVEKLNSDIETAKKDSLKLLIKLTEKASNIQLEKYFKEMWNPIKEQVLTRQSNDIKILALETIKCLMASLSKEDQTCNNAVNTVLTETMSSISDFEANLFDPCFDIICSCLRSSDTIALLMIPKVLPILISLQKTVPVDQKSEALKYIERICTILDNLNTVTKLNKTDLELLLNEVMHILIYEIDLNILENNLQIIQRIIKVIPKNNRDEIYSKLIDMAGATEYNKMLSCISSTIGSFRIQYPIEVSRLVNENLKLSAIAHSNSQLMKLLVNLLLVQNIKEENISHCISQCILSDKLDDIQLDILKYLVEILNKNEDILSSIEIYDIKTLICFIQKHQNLSSDFLKCYKILLEMSIKKSDEKDQKQIILKVLSESNPDIKSDLYILSGLLGQIRIDSYINENFKQLLKKIIKSSTTTKDNESRTICNHLLCSLFNKVPDNMDNIITKPTLEHLVDLINIQIKGSIETFSWISKGLLIRGFYDYGAIIDIVVHLLNDPAKAHMSLIAIDIICQECPHIYLPYVRPLFKQKLWNYIIKKFEHQFNELSEEHIVVLIRIITILPVAILKNDISKVGPLLIKAIGLKDNQYIPECLNMFSNLTECHKFFSTYATTIILKLLNLAQFADSMKIRIAALECLFNLTVLPTYILLPLKDDVTYGIIPILDDNKRLVRNAARKTRLKWCLIGEPEDV